MSDKNEEWIFSIKRSLENDGGGDLWYIINTMIDEKKMDFCHFLSKAAIGNGTWIHEGLGYSLDQDWDYPEQFNDVYFFIGECESSKLSFEKFVSLMWRVVDAYIKTHPSDRDSILLDMKLLEKRYCSVPVSRS